MKKIFFLLLLAVTVCSCNNNSNKQTDNEELLSEQEKEVALAENINEDMDVEENEEDEHIGNVLRLLSTKKGMSFVANSANYCESNSDQWSEWSNCAMPIFLNRDEIIFGSFPKGVFKIVEKIGQTSDDGRGIAYKCTNSKGTEFMVNLHFSSEYDAEMTVESEKVKMGYKCTLSNEKPYCNMVDLGLSCKWGLTNYYNYSTDIVSATYGAGKSMTYDEAYDLFGTSEQHLPTTSQINELLNSCSWEFIKNPEFEFHNGYLVTGPNGNSIFFPCNDGGDGNFSFGWYLGSEEFDAYLVNALQLNVDNRIVYPYERHYYGNIRLVEDK